MSETTTVITNLSEIITTDMINGVLNQVLGLLPTVLPAMITFIGFRKGISFLQHILHAA